MRDCSALMHISRHGQVNHWSKISVPESAKPSCRALRFLKKNLIQTAVLSFGFQILIAKLSLFWLCRKYNNLSASSAAAKKAHILYKWRVCEVFLQFTVNIGDARLLFIQLSFQRTHLGSQRSNNPISLQYLIEVWQRWPLHSITTNSIVQLLCYIR